MSLRNRLVCAKTFSVCKHRKYLKIRQNIPKRPRKNGVYFSDVSNIKLMIIQIDPKKQFDFT